MKVRDVIKQIEADGWVFARRGGRASHQIYKKKGIVSEIAISGAASDDVRQVSFKAFVESQGCR